MTVTLLGFFLLIVLVWAGLQTRWAKDRVAGLVASVTSESDTYRVHMEGLRGVLPFSILVDQITLSDEQGVWIESRKINISLNPWALFGGRLEANWIRMDRLALTRLPFPADVSSKKREKGENDAGLISLPRFMLREMHIKRIELAKAVAGMPLGYSLTSRIETVDGRIEAKLMLKDLQRTEDALRLRGAYDLRSEHVSAKLSYQESPGGLVGGLCHLKDAKGIRLEWQAHGPVSNVTGFLNIKAEGYGKAILNYRLGIPGTTSLALDGRVEVERSMLPPQVAAVLGGPGVDITCRATMSPKKMLQIETLTARAPSTTLSLHGTADLNKEIINVQLIADPVNISPFMKETGFEYQNISPIRLTAKGPFNQPEITLSANTVKLWTQDVTLKHVNLKADAVPGKDLSGFVKAEISLVAQGMDGSRIPGLHGPFQMKLLAKSPDFATWAVEKLHLTASHMDVLMHDARIDTREGHFFANIETCMDRLRNFMPSGPSGVDAKLTTHIQATGNYLTRQIAADLSATLSDLTGLSSGLAASIGSTLNLSTHVSIKDETLILRHASIHASGGDVKADGQINIRTGALDLTYYLNLNPIPEKAEISGVKWMGAASSRGTLTGELSDFSADIRLDSTRLQINRLAIQDLKTRIIAKGLPQKPAGTLNVKGTVLDQPASLNIGFAWSGDTLTLSQSQADLPGISLSADLNIEPGKRRISGTGEGEVTSFVLLQAMTGVDVRGTGRFKLNSEGVGEDVNTILEAHFKDLTYDVYGVAALDIKTLITHLDTLQGRMTIDAGNIARKTARLEKLRLQAEGNLHNARIYLDSRGSTARTGLDSSGNVPMALSAMLEVQHKNMWRFRLDSLKASYKDLDITLPHPAIITMSGGRIVMDDVTLNTANGHLQAKGELDQDQINLSTRIDHIPLALLEPLIDRHLTGTATLKLDLSGPLTGPAMDVGVHIRDYRIAGVKGASPLIVEAKINARRRKDRFQVNAELSGLGHAPFTAHATIPAHLSLKPLAFHLNDTEDLTAELKGHLDLKILSAFPGMKDQRIRGQVDVELGVKGPIKQWALTGGLTLTQGRYENVGLGMILENIQARVRARDRALFLTESSATDGAKGTLSLEGDINIKPPFPITAQLSLNQAVLIRKELLTSTTSGKLDVGGDKDKLKLTGEITLDRTELTIPRRLPPDVVEIPVKEINLPEDMALGEPQAPGEHLKFLSTDLKVKIPARFFVRGHGLDAEFKGQINVKGPANKPVVRGTLSVVRGTYQFLARTFHITEGQIAFDGSVPPTPFLNVVAEVSAGEIDAQVRITGPTNAFNLSLSSQPPLPQDEIMANILFGQSAAKLNPFQAYQLASALAQLSGRDLPDVMGKTRQLLGMDRLSISGGNNDDDSDSGPSVEAGKYVSDNVYVGVEQDLTDAKQDVVVEVDITPNFAVKSKTGTKSGAGLGFSWKYDY